MTLDQLDAAFVRRLGVRPQRPRVPVAAAARPAGFRSAGPLPRPAARSGGGGAPTPAVEAARPAVPLPGLPPVEVADEEPIVARLLARAAGEWAALAGHLEAARQRGRRVVAVAGGRPGEGRTTLVKCLAATLRARGREVACATPHDLALVADGPDGRGPTHDRRIVLVDAGVWFPPGPIRRSLLQVASLGCEAAILVRRSGAADGEARRAALESLGIEVLGEVLTFTEATAAVVDDGGSPA